MSDTPMPAAAMTWPKQKRLRHVNLPIVVGFVSKFVSTEHFFRSVQNGLSCYLRIVPRSSLPSVIKNVDRDLLILGTHQRCNLSLSDACTISDVYFQISVISDSIVENTTRLDHVMDDLPPRGRNSPDIPMSLLQLFFTLRFQIRIRHPNRDMGMSGNETKRWIYETGMNFKLTASDSPSSPPDTTK